MRINGKRIQLMVPTTMAVLLVFWCVLMIGGVSGVFAAETAETEFEIEVGSKISITTPNAVNLSCSGSGLYTCSASASITTSTNSSAGYVLQMNATSGYSDALINAATSATIPTLTQAYAAANFPTNYWGYTGGTDQSGVTGGYDCSSDYCPILAYESSASNYAPNHVIKEASTSGSSSTTVGFMAKADGSKPSGTYSTSVTFTAVANPEPTPASGITNGMNM